MDLRDVKLSSCSELFPADILEIVVEKSFKVLHDVAIRKAVSRDKPVSQGKKLHFSNPLHQQQRPQQQHSKKPTESSSVLSFWSSSLTVSSSKASSSSSYWGKGKTF